MALLLDKSIKELFVEAPPLLILPVFYFDKLFTKKTLFFTTCLLHTLSYNEITSSMIQFQYKLLQAQNSKKNRTFGYGKYKNKCPKLYPYNSYYIQD